MKFINKWLNPHMKGKKDKNNTEKESRVSTLLESLSSIHEQTRGPSGRRNAICVPTTSFVPRTQGQEATIAYLSSGTTSDLSQLLSDRDRAERLARRGPKTKATREVQDVLREPSVKTVEKFYHVFRQAEIVIRYGIVGEVVYNFSKTPSWNTANISRLPSLQLNDIGNMMREHNRYPAAVSSIPRNPLPPIDWIDLGMSRSPARHHRRTPSIVSEPGGWRELPRPDTNEEQVRDLRSPYPVTQETSVEEEWEIQDARILTVTKVPIRQVHIISSKR